MPMIAPKQGEPQPERERRGSGTPSVASWNVQATEIAMRATSERSMPRPITTSAMAMPSMPRRNAAQQREKILRGQESGQQDREDRKQQDRKQKDDLLLTEGKAPFHGEVLPPPEA